MPLFIVGVVAAVLVGCYVPAILFDIVQGDSLSQVFASNAPGGVTYQWIGYALFAWCIPILVTLLVRYVDHRINPRSPGVYPANYAFIAILGAIVAAASLTGAVHVIEPLGSQYRDMDVSVLLFMNFPWYIGPGILCAYIVFRLDTFRLQDEAVWVMRRLRWIAACVLVVGLVSIPATFMTPAVESWSLNKTYTVVMMTVLMIAFVLASITEYVRAPAPHEPQSPAGTGMESV